MGAAVASVEPSADPRERERLLDTLLATSYRAAGVSRLATTGWRDFDTLGAFEVVRIGG